MSSNFNNNVITFSTNSNKYKLYGQVYLSVPNMHYRNGTHLFVYPDYNPTTMVANLAILAIDSGFSEQGEMGWNMIDNNLNRIPTSLSLKGFGRWANHGKEGQPLKDNEGVRNVKVKYEEKVCPNANDGLVRFLSNIIF